MQNATAILVAFNEVIVKNMCQEFNLKELGAMWLQKKITAFTIYILDSKVYGAYIGPTWVMSAPDGPHVGPMNLAIRDGYHKEVIAEPGVFKSV